MEQEPWLSVEWERFVATAGLVGALSVLNALMIGEMSVISTSAWFLVLILLDQAGYTVVAQVHSLPWACVPLALTLTILWLCSRAPVAVAIVTVWFLLNVAGAMSFWSVQAG